MMALLSFVQTVLIKRGLHINVQIPFSWTGGKVSQYTFFSDDEIKGLDKELCAMLDWARGRAGVPFVITCGLRTADHNEQVGGVQDSSHLKGLGVDLACSDSVSRYKMVQALLLAGFRRVGVYTAHIHVDRDTTLPDQVMWIGVSH